jgi:hypothetical protein
MNCKNCGSPLVPEDKFCKLCGTPVQKNNNVGMPANPQGPAPMPKPISNQPMNPTPTPVKVEPPTPVKVNGPVGPGPVKPMNQPNNNLGPKPNHGMNLGETQVLGPMPGIKPNVNNNGMPGNKPIPNNGLPGNKPIPNNGMPGNKPAPNNGMPPKPNGMVANAKPMPMPPKPTTPAPVPGMPMNNAPIAPEPESKGGAMKVVLIILLILGLAVGGYFGYKALTNNDDDGNGGGNDNPVAVSTKKVDFSGYTFEVPTKFMVKTESGMLNIDDGTFGFYMKLMDYSYSQISPEKVVSNGTSQGFTMDYKGEKDYSGTKYHLFTIKQGGESLYAIYVPLGASKLLALTIYNNPTSVLPTQANLDEVLKISLSGEYTGSHNMETEGIEKVDPRNFLVDGEAKSTGDVADYVEEFAYADVTVEEVY